MPSAESSEIEAEDGETFPWSLSVGNFVSICWVNYRGRSAETNGVIRSHGNESVNVSSDGKNVSIGIGRITRVDVIKESKQGREVRKKAWFLLRDAARSLNKQTAWEEGEFFSVMEDLARIFPKIKNSN